MLSGASVVSFKPLCCQEGNGEFSQWKLFVFHSCWLCYRDISGALLTIGSSVGSEASQGTRQPCALMRKKIVVVVPIGIGLLPSVG